MQCKIIGAGLAGCEAALWLADAGVQVDLYEQKPGKFSPAHKSQGFAELICSNSLKAERPDSASGLLKLEMRAMGSHLLPAAETARVAAGGALAVDRDVFSAAVTAEVERHPNITIHREEVTALDESAPVLVASGPLTEGALAEAIAALTGDHRLSFYDAVAPIVTAESLDYEKVFAASRYGRGEADYLNCPFNKAEYEAFHTALIGAERAPLHDFDGDLTVRENTYLRGAMLGYTRKFMNEKYEEIIDFSGLQEFQDRPFKQLSSGMKSRLAFSIACLVRPDVLILDEVLSVGDGAFRKKSEEKMMEIINGGATTILVSHLLEQVRSMCNKALWLERGKQIAFGDANELCDRYEEFLSQKK